MTKLAASRGQSLVILTLVLPMLIGAVALAVDIAEIYFNWIGMQTGADAASLAGASYLPAFPDIAKTTATAYALQNGINAGEITSLQVSPDNLSLSIQVTRSIPYSFARVLGLSSATVSTLSTATAKSVGSGNGVAPFGIDYRTSLTFGQQVTIKAGQVGAGNWEPLALGGTGAANYLTNLENGYPGTVTIGDLLQTEPGNIVGPTKTGVDFRLSQGLSLFPSGTFANHALDDPRVVMVPMVDFSNVNGSSQVPVKGFAELWMVGANGNGSSINTYFIEQTSPGAKPLPGSDNFGAFSVVLSH